MLSKLSLIFITLVFLNSWIVSAKPIASSSADNLGDSALELKTNAERLSAGYSPLPPVKRWIASRADAARRSLTSPLPSTGGQIWVRTDDTGEALGYLSGTLVRGYYELTSSILNAGIFTYSDPYLRRVGAPAANPDVAAMIPPNRNMLVVDTINAILGESANTAPGAPPDLNANPSWPGYDAESAIWHLNPVTDSVTAHLVKDDGTMVDAKIIYYGSNLYLTPDPETVIERIPAAQVVFFTLL